MKNIVSILLLSIALVGYAKEPPWVIGLDADMSAVAASGGEAIKRGALIAIDEINANGGVLGRQVELKILDHRGNPARGVDNILAFSKEQNLIAVLGGVHTPVVLAELEVIHANKILYLVPWAAGTSVVDNGFEPNFVFRVSVRDEHAGKVLTQAVKKKNVTKVGLLLERTGWGRSNEISMEAALKDQGLSVSTVQWFNWGEKDFSSQIKALDYAGSQSVFLVSNAPEGAEFIKQYSNSELETVPVYSHWGIAGGAFVKLAGLPNISKIDLTVLQTFEFAHNSSKTEKSVI